MKLVVVHNHFRPGGVRRVIELAVPYLVRVLRPRPSVVVLVAGETPDEPWLRLLRDALGALPVVVRTDPALGYVAERRIQPASRARRLRRFWTELFDGPGVGNESVIVWAHNQGLGRNPALTRTLSRACADRRISLVLHHHDWWFDNRWQRWPEMRQAGCRSLRQVAAALLPAHVDVRPVAINQADAGPLRRYFGPRAGWLPNVVECGPRPRVARTDAARRWLDSRLGESAPVWIVPCRLLRRKNLAEALLLARWLRPEAWLVTTGGVSSAGEQAYARRLRSAAAAGEWRLRLGLLERGEAGQPSVPELLAASEAVLLTSILEGFGLPYVEATAARRPLIARLVPTIAPDLAGFGFRFPQAYGDLMIDPALFHWTDERDRQRILFRAWKQRLPRACRGWAGTPPLLAAAASGRPVPFSRLTLTAQLEVLQHPVETSWRRCLALNPFLEAWRDRAARRGLQVTDWPAGAEVWLGGAAYARRFQALLDVRARTPVPPAAGLAAQEDLIREKLRSANLFPLVWDPPT